MRLILECEHGKRVLEIEDAYKWANPERALIPVCPYCDIVERPKAQFNAQGWQPQLVQADAAGVSE